MSEAQSPELRGKIAIWRQKQEDGTLTLDDMREAILALRQGRVSAVSESPAAKRKKAIAAVPDADDMLSDLMK